MFRLALHWQILITMTLGAVLGVVLNGTVSKLSTTAPTTQGEKPTWEISDSSDRIEIKMYHEVERYFSETIKDKRNEPIEDEANEDEPTIIEIEPEFVEEWSELVTETYLHIIVDGSLEKAKIKELEKEGIVHFRSLKEFEKSTEKDSKKSEEYKKAYELFQEHGRSWSRYVGDVAKLIGDLFLRMLKMVSIPLIITSLVTGVTGLGKAERLGKMFSRTMLYYICTSMLAITTGLVMVNMIKPGVDEERPAITAEESGNQRQEQNLPDVLYGQIENMIPANPIHSIGEGNFLSIIAFSLLIGIFTILVGGKTAELISNLFQAFFEVMMKMTIAIIHLAPIGVLFMMLSVTATQGIGIFELLGWYMITVALALAFHAVITMPLILKFIAKRSPWEFSKAMSPALLTAFSSASSNGTLPLTLTSVEKRAGVSNRVSSFVLPLGATINMDGTALYEVVAVLFIAQYSGIDLSLTQQIIVAFTALLASIGAAGIPHAGLVMMVIVLQAVNLPTESQGLIIAVDRVLDMARTSVNVWSDSCGCAVIAKMETESSS